MILPPGLHRLAPGHCPAPADYGCTAPTVARQSGQSIWTLDKSVSLEGTPTEPGVDWAGDTPCGWYGPATYSGNGTMLCLDAENQQGDYPNVRVFHFRVLPARLKDLGVAIRSQNQSKDQSLIEVKPSSVANDGFEAQRVHLRVLLSGHDQQAPPECFENTTAAVKLTA